MRNIRVIKDDRRYMTHEQRAIDDPKYRGTVQRNIKPVTTCHCGKTVLASQGKRVTQSGNPVYCPRECESKEKQDARARG